MDIDVYKWQTLIGSFLGPFLAVILSYLMWSCKRWWNHNNNRKENIRVTEIILAQTLNHIGIVIFQLEYFIKQINSVIDEVNNINNEGQYSMPTTNFQATANIYFDENILKEKFGSFYLHNKLIEINNFVKVSNENTQQFRYDFEKLLDRNERVVQMKLMLPKKQRESYIENLKNFIKMIQEIVNVLKGEYVKCVAEARIYNLKLKKNYGRTLYKYEGRFKYFKSKKEMDKFIGNKKSIDRINKLLKDDTKKMVNEIISTYDKSSNI